jgi:ribonuclease BN (tRNA processing enzyme)
VRRITGVVRPAAAARQKGVLGLDTVALRIGFIMHLHSDHTLGLPDVMLTTWIMGRKEPLTIERIPAAIRRAQMSAGKQEAKSNC